MAAIFSVPMLKVGGTNLLLFVGRAISRLHDDRLLAAVIREQLQQPLVEPAHFDDALITTLVARQLSQLTEERVDFVPLCTDLPPQDDVPRVVADADG